MTRKSLMFAASLLWLGLAAAVAQEAPASELEQRYRIRGIFAGAAAIEDLRTGTQRGLRLGGEVDGWKVESIGSAGVVFVKDGRRVTLVATPATEGESEPIDLSTPENQIPGGPGAGEQGSGADSAAPGVELQLVVGSQAYFRVWPEGRSVSRRAGEPLGKEWRVLEVARSAVRLEGAAGELELQLGGRVSATEVLGSSAPGRSGLAAAEPVAPLPAATGPRGLVYLGDVGNKAVFELDAAQGRRQLTVAVGEEVSPGLVLAEFDAARAVLEDRGRGNQRLELARGAMGAQASSARDSGQQPAGSRIPLYPWRVPLWERSLGRILDETKLTLRLTARDLDECIDVLVERHGLPLCLDADVLEELADAELLSDISAFELPARQVVDQLLSGKSLMVVPAFGCLMIGLPRNLSPIADRLRTRDAVLRQTAELRQAIARIPDFIEGKVEAALDERLRFTQVELAAEVTTLKQLLALIGTELSVSTTTASTLGRDDAGADEAVAPGTRPSAGAGEPPVSGVAATAALPVPPGGGKRPLRAHLLAVLEPAGLTYRWNGNLLQVLPVKESELLDAERSRLAEEQKKLRAELLELPREADLLLAEPLTGPLWFVAERVTAAGGVEVFLDPGTWEREGELHLPAGAKLGDLLDQISAIPGIRAVRASDTRLYVLSL